jgi:hypothetical protein
MPRGVVLLARRHQRQLANVILRKQKRRTACLSVHQRPAAVVHVRTRTCTHAANWVRTSAWCAHTRTACAAASAGPAAIRCFSRSVVFLPAHALRW